MIPLLIDFPQVRPNVVSAFQQSLSNVTQKQQKLTVAPERKVIVM